MTLSQVALKCLSNYQHPLYLRALQREINSWGAMSPEQVLSNIENHPVVLAYQNEMITGSRTANYGEWMNVFVTNYPRRRKGLSLGSGTGLAEQELFDRHFVERLDAVDLVNTGSKSSGTKVGLMRADLNFVEFRPHKYDLVFCHGILHHIINLEWLAYQICQTLSDDGLVIVYEYIGEDHWQWSEERQSLLNGRLRSEFGNRYRDFIVSRPAKWGMSSFESIRSSEVWPVFTQRFGRSIERQVAFGGALYPILNSLSRMRHYSSADSTKILEFAVELDKQVTREGSLAPCLLFGIYSKGHCAEVEAKVGVWDEQEIKLRLDERAWMPPMLRAAEVLRHVPLMRAGYRRVKKLLWQQ